MSSQQGTRTVEQRATFAEERTWEGIPARIVLQPIAAPSILGLFGLAGATLIVGANLADWYGNDQSPQFLFPFAAAVGGIAQLTAGVWAYRSRDALATVVHGIWGTFWLAYGVLWGFIAAGALDRPAGAWPELGFWFIALGAVTAFGALASLAESLGVFAVLATLAAGSGLLAGALIADSSTTEQIAGWVLVFAAGLAWYTAGAMMMAAGFGRTILPLGKYERELHVPWRPHTMPVEVEHGEPTVRQGQ